MSKATTKPITIPAGVEVKIDGQYVSIKGAKGSLALTITDEVKVTKDGDKIVFALYDTTDNKTVVIGTSRALIRNIFEGVSKGYERKLILVGVGYKAQTQGNDLNLALGFSHPIKYRIPEGIKIETPSQTEITIRGIDKYLVGQVAAEIRAYRPPEPYKGKGVRYSDEVIVLKEGKKK